MTETAFLAQSLNSRQLLGLLFICEATRKGIHPTVNDFKRERPADWDDLLNTFAARFTNLGETMRFEVLEAHLMSVEDIDVYHNETLERLLNENRPLLDLLTEDLNRDPRFRLDT